MKSKFGIERLSRLVQYVFQKDKVISSQDRNEKKVLKTITDIIFEDFLILHQIFLLAQAKGSVIMSNKHGIYELPHELLKDLRLTILGD